jgi:2-octaprenylphenol hydroxylase
MQVNIMIDKPSAQDKETMPLEVDIAIVGAGMVGAALAAALGQTNYKLAIIDAQSEQSLLREVHSSSRVEDFEPRVSALTLASQTLLRDAGAWPLMPKQLIQPYRKMRVWDQLGTAEIVFDAAEIYQDALGCIVENQVIVSALQKVLQTQSNLQRFYGQPIDAINLLSDTDSQHCLTLANGQQIQCRLLVAADGASSRIRQWAGIATREWDYQHSAIVCTVQTEKAHELTAWQRFSETGPVAFLPLSDADSSQRFCSIVWSQDTERAKYLMAMDDASFQAALEKEIEARLGKLSAVSRRDAFPLRQRHAKTYVKPGLVLAGDAAHTIHPLAGQGVNLGFKDVKALAEILKKAESQHLDVNDMLLLKRYQRQRQGDNLLMMGAMEGFKQLFSQPDPIVRWLRNAGLDWVNKQTFLKNQIAKQAMGLHL